MKEDENIKTDFEVERNELNLLIQRGFHFEVGGKTFVIQQPTLGVLDRISDITLDMAINEDEINQGDESNAIYNARKLVKKNAKRCAKVVAIMVLGELYNTEKWWKKLIYLHRLRKLTDFFFHTLTPSKLVGLAIAVTNTSNFADFCASMRLLSGARTTQKIKESIE